MDTAGVAEGSDPEFGPLVHEERLKTPLLFLFGFSYLLMLGLAIGLLVIVAAAERQKPLTGGDWLGIALLDGFFLLSWSFQLSGLKPVR